MTVFVDAFALIAWLNPRDESHALVAEYLDRFTGRLVTTEWVLMELADALSAPRHAAQRLPFFKQCGPTPCSTLSAMTSTRIRPASNYFASRLDKSWSLTDCISFAVMTNARFIRSSDRRPSL